MGIYVKYMEMPEGCVTCYLKHDCCDFKQQISSGNIIKYIDKRLDTCPLIEVTEPHGNLIDYNFVYDELEKICTRCRSVGADRIDPKCGICWVNDFLSILNTAPTVIEAEGE